MFGPFERMVAGRYLRARKGERFVSIIAIFSLVGIALGVATLIVVTSGMSDFQTELRPIEFLFPIHRFDRAYSDDPAQCPNPRNGPGDQKGPIELAGKAE